MSQNICIYHKNCLDGIAAAWVVWKFFNKDVFLHPAQYGDKLPEGLDGKNVYIVDFSYPAEVLIELSTRANVVVLDHHKTAMDDCRRAGSLLKTGEHKCEIIFDMNKSGASLAWDYFYKDIAPPWGIKFVEDRDLWKWEFRLTKYWTTVAFSYPKTVDHIDALMRIDPDDTVPIGEALLRKQEQDVKALARSSRVIDIDGFLIVLVNASANYASDLGEHFKDGNLATAVYHDDLEGRVFSLRSGGFKVNKLAERFGGGGHEKAAGFKIKYNDPRFGKSHVRLRSKGYWWRKIKDYFGIKEQF